MADLSLGEKVRAWIAQDPDPDTSAELATLAERAASGDQSAEDTLRGLFAGHLTFGTAGLRGKLGPGPSQMNRLVVSHAAHGLGRFLLDHVAGSPAHVVVGFDARHKSGIFADDTAEILSGMGIRVSLFSHTTPTPVLAFALRHLEADAAAMVTASHNPPEDNGYKVYLGGADNGSQIIPPADSAIHSEIIASHDTIDATRLTRSRDKITTISGEIVDAYITDTLGALQSYPRGNLADLRVCYTPLHGVGRDVSLDIFARMGVGHVSVVESQSEPDPTFPTVAYPNPEEAGALDHAFVAATDNRCDLIIAHDPDADRLAVAVPDSASPGGWRMLSGNQLGALLLSAVAENRAQAGESGTLSSSLVSSPIISRIAEHNGLTHWECPTGFKWISRAPGIVAGFEEALGYLVTPHVVSDKDGISAAALALKIAGVAKQEGGSLDTVLHQVMDKYGAFSSDQVTVRLDSAAEAASLMSALRARHNDWSIFFSDSDVVDFLHTDDSFPPADMVRFTTRDGGRVIFRPSGTEPKLKIYVDAFGASLGDAAQKVATLAVQALKVIDILVGKAEESA